MHNLYLWRMNSKTAMISGMKNFAFIDARNVHLGIKSLGWELDWGRFRVYLREKYKVISDEDFYSLVRHLYENDKLFFVLSLYVKTCSKLLRKEAREKIYSMDNLRQKLGREKFRK